ncbi:hypothetical protein Pfo_010962 [Paulownia fortunei]|nr:hypothetical protein Pfo_010962 [Paulownia fortunei]
MKRHWFANNDIPINILCRLPAKTLHCLKYVPKEWLNVISDRPFISFQLKRTEPVSGFFFQEVFKWTDDEDMESIIYIPVDVENVKVWRNVLNFLHESVVILSLNNGLLCCQNCFPTSQPRIYVCNPLNKHWTSLQWPNISQNSSAALAFDPFQNTVDVSTDFKLVAVSHIETREYKYCFVLTYIRQKQGCGEDQKSLSWLTTAPLPATGFSSIPDMCIGDSHSRLYYVIISEDGLQLWVLEDHFASQWELQISISLDEFENENSIVLYKISEKVAKRLYKGMLAWMDPLAFKDGMLLLRVSANIYSYQFDTRKMRKLWCVSTLGPKSMFSPIVVPYTMSLVPLGQAQIKALSFIC